MIDSVAGIDPKRTLALSGFLRVHTDHHFRDLRALYGAFVVGICSATPVRR